jgi:uncharacterized membrane protein
MGFTKENVVVPLPPDRALDLWTNLRRWPTFYEGFARVKRAQGEWPAAGSRLTWESIPGGRGIVTEKVLEYEPAQRIVTEIFDEALSGRQTARFAPDEGGGSRVQLELDYTLTKSGILRRISDVLFIRRALTDSLRRTLIRFAREAEDEAAL